MLRNSSFGKWLNHVQPRCGQSQQSTLDSPVEGNFSLPPYEMEDTKKENIANLFEKLDVSGEEVYVLALDIGTTMIRAYVYDRNINIVGSFHTKAKLLHPQPTFCEIEPDTLYNQVLYCLDGCIKDSGLTYSQITCMGMATQRNTFITWDRETGKPFHNFITWQDLRGKEYVKDWNHSYTMKALNTGAKLLHTFTRSPRHLAASVLRFLSPQVTMRLKWLLNHNELLKDRLYQNQVLFGCIDTWLLWKLTAGRVHATDYSCASSTGLFDPFQMEWSSVVCKLLDIPMTIFPELKDTSGLFGRCDPQILGAAIPITGIVADQQGAMFGDCCYTVGDVKCTMGSGTFIDLNTGNQPHASIAGLYPLVGWKIGSELVFIAEGVSSDSGCVLEWAKSLSIFEEESKLADIAESVPDNGGVYFVAAFSGLQAPINDDTAVTTMIGMTPNTAKAHVVRAILESLAFRFKLLYETMLTETKLPISSVRVNGGVSNNRFVLQLMSDLTSQVIEKSKFTDMTNLGVAFLAGLGHGIWKCKEELFKLRGCDRVYTPQKKWNKYKNIFRTWERAVNRSKKWYSQQ
ncbi:putative glycerol kinase 5 [Octopus vulgaris]|uniref:Glycerol kinase 5 n=3 Tax=Octopus TaxID=6643 RepID=A0AA36AUW1_OCTVU|nr:putative glycerol kinase 5 isoform X1 [Octopus sinensis]CAI9722036.1 putative glycerol kinase 5 [Octopus vulgaris]